MLSLIYFRSEYRGTNASSLRLALSDSSSNTMTQYHATPGIVLNQFKAKNGIVLGQHQTLKDVEIEKTPTNSPVRIGQASKILIISGLKCIHLFRFCFPLNLKCLDKRND